MQGGSHGAAAGCPVRVLRQLRHGVAAPATIRRGWIFVTVRVVLSTGASLEHTGGEKEFEIEAKNVRGVIKALEARFPGLGEFLEEDTTVAIDGELHEAADYQPLREGCEVYFLPKIEAG